MSFLVLHELIQSLLTQERGLKPLSLHPQTPLVQSLLTQERGLKQIKQLGYLDALAVAPHAGAWIETLAPYHPVHHCRVAPHAGAWIETR